MKHEVKYIFSTDEIESMLYIQYLTVKIVLIENVFGHK